MYFQSFLIGNWKTWKFIRYFKLFNIAIKNLSTFIEKKTKRFFKFQTSIKNILKFLKHKNPNLKIWWKFQVSKVFRFWVKSKKQNRFCRKRVLLKSRNNIKTINYINIYHYNNLILKNNNNKINIIFLVKIKSIYCVILISIVIIYIYYNAKY